MLDIAQEAGLVNGEARQQWESDFYIPFYRVLADEDGVISKKHGHSDTGLMRQEVIKRLKGGKENLGDPLEKRHGQLVFTANFKHEEHGGKQSA